MAGISINGVYIAGGPSDPVPTPPAPVVPPPVPGFYQLVVKNEWMALTYSLNGEPWAPDKGEAVHVRWPDGSESTHRLAWNTRSASYSDHGLPTRVTQRLPRVRYQVRGLRVSVALTELEVWWAG